VYALTAPFFSLADDFSFRTLEAVWKGENQQFSLLIQDMDYRIFQHLWPDASPEQLIIIQSPSESVQYQSQSDILYLTPFNELTPEWKVLRVDGISPLDKTFTTEGYPLVVHFGFKSPDQIAADLQLQPDIPATNRDQQKLTLLTMTGTTALTRAIGFKMEQNGMTYPAEKIKDWLQSSDITHISNEVSFTPNCPPADYDQRSMVFCSRPEYINLLEDVGADVIELSGNHNLDWGTKPYLYSLELYPKYQMQVYAGGKTRAEARRPLLLEDHGNKLAFLGCNCAGPSSAIAGVDSPGAAFCNYDYFENKIGELKAQGYLPIMTLQHSEYYHTKLSEKQIAEFRQMAQAGAIIVQGSQAHFPQPMEFQAGAFIHYGLGNLFFDQMDRPVKGTRREFIDRYTIYDGRLISIELLTAMLEDYSQPRPMTFAERQAFLEEIFAASASIP
jgi:poly-gamma-glutamate synthesis protein (capsule biosynthesis protein)